MATKNKKQPQPDAAEKSVTKKRGGPRPNSGGPRPNSGGAREGAGRKPFEPTDHERKQVEAMSGYGVPIEQIAVLVRDGIDADTLRKHFAQELIAGKAKANAQVGKTLFQKVMAGDTTAAIWWTKTQMRWAETHRLEHTSPDGSMTAEYLTDAQLVAILKASDDDDEA